MAPLIVLACVLALASGTSNSIMLTLNADSAGLPFRRLWGTQVKPCSNNNVLTLPFSSSNLYSAPTACAHPFILMPTLADAYADAVTI